jgi:GT2 family glycosyltransferase
MLPKVYIILVNHNNHYDTIECLESVLKNKYQNYQVIVVDNSATSDSINFFKTWTDGQVRNIPTKFENLVYPLETTHSYIFLEEKDLSSSLTLKERILFLKSDKNSGFAHANNLAIKYTKTQNDASFIWLLNNDTVIDKNALTNLVSHAYGSKGKTGIWGAKLLMYFKSEFIQGV